MVYEKPGIYSDLAIGDFDSLSEEGQKYMESLKGPEIIRLKPEGRMIRIHSLR